MCVRRRGREKWSIKCVLIREGVYYVCQEEEGGERWRVKCYCKPQYVR